MMAPSTQHTLKTKGRVRLVQTSNPVMGVGYSVWDRNLGLWRGVSLIEAEQEFQKAIAATPR